MCEEEVEVEVVMISLVAAMIFLLVYHFATVRKHCATLLSQCLYLFVISGKNETEDGYVARYHRYHDNIRKVL